jgi:hypothetical protein
MTPVSQLIAALQQELAQLERKATRIRELLADYADQAQPQALAAQSQMVAAQGSMPLPLREAGPRPSKKALIKNEIEQLLLSKGPTHRKEILAILEFRGLMGHEKDPMASLAAYLSAFSDNFVNDGSGTWSIREPTKAQMRKPIPDNAA